LEINLLLVGSIFTESLKKTKKTIFLSKTTKNNLNELQKRPRYGKAFNFLTKKILKISISNPKFNA